MKMPSPTEAGLLMSLGSQRLSGRELAERYLEETGRNISYGTLYTTMSRMGKHGWIEQENSEDEDGRLRYFRVTGDGVSALSESKDFFSRLFGFKRRARAA